MTRAARTLTSLVLLACTWLTVAPGRAQVASEPPSSTARTLGLGSLGFVTGFLAHESGHLAANLMLGNVPAFEGLMVFGFIPFFAITPRINCYGDECTKHDGERFAAGHRGKYAIVSAGYNVQHLTDEVLLTRRPGLRFEDAPYQKGVLAFNVFLSCMYAFAALTGLQDPHGDMAGMARLSNVHHVPLAFALLAPAALDTFRYFVPGSQRWSAWVSRGTKLAFVGLNFTF
jgi:hypothetical protein